MADSRPLFTFIHVTDTHLSAEKDVLSPFIEAVNTERFHPRPNVVVFGGDTINGNRNDGAVCAVETTMLRDRLDRLHVPFLTTCHNHDTWGEAHLGAQYRAAFGEDAFSYVRDFPGGFRGVFMSGMFERNGTVVDLYDQTDWLDAALADAGARRVLLFMHVPLFPPRKPVPAAVEPTLRSPRWHAGHFYFKPPYADPLLAVIRRHSCVVAHYSGHCHVHSVRDSQGVRFIATGALATRPWEYRHVAVYPDRLVHRVYGPVGEPKPASLGPDGAFWVNCIDADHPTVAVYHDGLPAERDFTLLLHRRP